MTHHPLFLRAREVLTDYKYAYGDDPTALTKLMAGYKVNKLSEMTIFQMQDVIDRFGKPGALPPRNRVVSEAIAFREEAAVQTFISLWQRGLPLREAFVTGALMLPSAQGARS